MYSPSSSSEDIESEDDNANAAEETKYTVLCLKMSLINFSNFANSVEA